MNKQEVIEQLESLIDNSKSHIDDELDSIWHKDIQALEIAISIVEVHYNDNEA